MGSLGFPEETLLRFVRLIKSGGLKAKPQFALKFNKSDIPISGNRAYGAYVVPAPRTSGMKLFHYYSAYKTHWSHIFEYKSFSNNCQCVCLQNFSM